MNFPTKAALTVTFAATLTGCMQAAPIPLDDPRWAEADARFEGTLYGASGIAGLAHIGASFNPENSPSPEGAIITYDEAFSNAAEIAAAPGNICRHLGGSVETSHVVPGIGYDSQPPSTHVLWVTCTI
jgi:hypothetical protein